MVAKSLVGSLAFSAAVVAGPVSSTYKLTSANATGVQASTCAKVTVTSTVTVDPWALTTVTGWQYTPSPYGMS
jgi:hypothetical protein